jgi:hypothetical protein
VAIDATGRAAAAQRRQCRQDEGRRNGMHRPDPTRSTFDWRGGRRRWNARAEGKAPTGPKRELHRPPPLCHNGRWQRRACSTSSLPGEVFWTEHRVTGSDPTASSGVTGVRSVPPPRPKSARALRRPESSPS